MATQRRPSRPVTRVPQPAPGAVHSAPTTRMPQKGAGGPPTRSGGRVVKPAGREGGHSTRSVAPAGKKNNTPIILAAAGGGVLLSIVVAFMMSGGSGHKERAAAPKKKAAPAAVDVASLERDGQTKCDQGLALIMKNEAFMTGKEPSASEKAQLVADLDKGVHLISDGMNKLDEANRKSGNLYDTSKYGKAHKAAKMKLLEMK